MKHIGADVQASNKLLGVLSDSHLKSGEILDRLPGLFAIVDQDWQVLKGNEGLAECFHVSLEYLLDRSFSELFGAESWRAFLAAIRQLESDPNRKSVEFELSIDGNGNGGGIGVPYYWMVSRFQIGKGDPARYYTVLGKDISQYKAALSEVIKLNKNLEIARTFQNLLIPQANSFDSGAFKIAAHYQAADSVGGDWWAHSLRSDGSLLVLLGDVTGHGVGSAMVTAGMTCIYRALNFLQSACEQCTSTTSMLEVFHQTLRSLGEGSYWITLAVLEILPSKQELLLHNTGNPPLFLFRGDTGDVDIISVAGTPLGSANPKAAIPVTVPYRPGDRILMFTDGLFEIPFSKGLQLGLARLRKIFLSSKDLPLIQAREAIVAQFAKLLGDRTAPDDMTFILIQL